MNDDEITADDVRAGLRAIADDEKKLAVAARFFPNWDPWIGTQVYCATVDARDRRLSERTMLAAEARADAEREDLR